LLSAITGMLSAMRRNLQRAFEIEAAQRQAADNRMRTQDAAAQMDMGAITLG